MVQVAAKITEEDKEKFEVYCKENDIKMAQLIRRALKEYIENHS